jgi:hypothetical protein
MCQKSFSNEPFHSKDAENMIFGCRQTNPVNCAKNSLYDICAFARKDNICLAPPRSWRRKFKELKNN